MTGNMITNKAGHPTDPAKYGKHAADTLQTGRPDQPPGRHREQPKAGKP